MVLEERRKKRCTRGILDGQGIQVNILPAHLSFLHLGGIPFKIIVTENAPKIEKISTQPAYIITCIRVEKLRVPGHNILFIILELSLHIIYY